MVPLLQELLLPLPMAPPSPFAALETGLPTAPMPLANVTAILKLSSFLTSRVPAPVIVPTAGRTASTSSAFSPSGAIRTLDVNFSISRSLPLFTPASEPRPDIFDPRSKFASLALNRPTLPEVTKRLVGPARVRLVFSVPPSSDAPFGILIPSAGRNATRSAAGIFWLLALMLTTAISPVVL